MLVYAGQNEGKKKQYMTRISAEAYNALVEWMDLRKRDGEKIHTTQPPRVSTGVGPVCVAM